MKRIFLGAAHAQDFETQKQVARYLARTTAQDYWLILYDFEGAKIGDVIVQAKVGDLAEDGTFIPPGEGTGSPESHVFAITRTRPQDEAMLADAFTDEMPAQMAWKRLPAGTFYVPREWPNHTNGRPHIGPFLMARWVRGEHPSIFKAWGRFARPTTRMMLEVTAITTIVLWIRSC